MKLIKLTKGKFAKVDNEDYKFLFQYKWCITAGYASRSLNRKILYMHRILLNAQKGQEVDHINLDILDNRRFNLRIVNRSKNMANTGLRKNNKSGAKGVIWDKRDNKWAVEITVNYKKFHLGRFEDKTEAIQIYNQKAKELFGEFARLNTL